MNPHPHGIWVDPEVHAAVVEYAWLKRTTVSAIVRAVLEHTIENPKDDTYLAVPDRPGRKRVGAKTTDELWEKATEVARQNGVSFYSIVRRKIIKVLQEEGLLS